MLDALSLALTVLMFGSIAASAVSTLIALRSHRKRIDSLSREIILLSGDIAGPRMRGESVLESGLIARMRRHREQAGT